MTFCRNTRSAPFKAPINRLLSVNGSPHDLMPLAITRRICSYLQHSRNSHVAYWPYLGGLTSHRISIVQMSIRLWARRALYVSVTRERVKLVGTDAAGSIKSIRTFGSVSVINCFSLRRRISVKQKRPLGSGSSSGRDGFLSFNGALAVQQQIRCPAIVVVIQTNGKSARFSLRNR